MYLTNRIYSFPNLHRGVKFDARLPCSYKISVDSCRHIHV